MTSGLETKKIRHPNITTTVTTTITTTTTSSSSSSTSSSSSRRSITLPVASTINKNMIYVL